MHGRDFLNLSLIILLSLGVSVAIMTMTLAPPRQDLNQLIVLMTVTGFGTMLIAFGLHNQRLFPWLGSLRWSLLLNLLVVIMIFLTNVWVTARLMFISEHDFYLTIGLLIFSAMISSAFGFYIAEKLTTRLGTLSKAAERIAGGDLSAQLDVREHDELAQFAHTFNWMVQNLREVDEKKRAIEQARRDLITGVSHDLRTPLTAIRARLESVYDGVVQDPDEIKRYVGDSLQETAHLSAMIDDLFQIAQVDSGHLNLTMMSGSLRDLISDSVRGLELHLQQANLQVISQIDDDVDPVRMAPEKIQRVLNNLLENAVQYTPPGGKIHLKAQRMAGAVCVEVRNSGAVIAPQHLPHLFDSFYRVDRARQGDGHQRHMGLGLAIARGFVEAHGGTISASSTAEDGTCFAFTLPV